MYPIRYRPWVVVCCAFLFVVCSQTASANTLCVRPGGGVPCFATIQSAVSAAAPNDVIRVAPGVYKEDVTIGKSVSLIGAGEDPSVIDATGLSNGFFVDGFDHPGLNNVTIAGFTVKNALFEGILVVSASDVTIRDNHVSDNDKSPGLLFTGATTGCPGQPSFETDETGDCGGAIHLIGTSNSIISGNLITGNADGLLISDETAESNNNLVTHNTFKDNPLECGIVLASHPPVGHISPPFAPHFGVDNNTVSENVSTGNGVQIGGAGVGLFSDGNGQGRVSGNVIFGNKLIGNGLGGVTLHTHVGPNFHLPADDMSNNKVIGNFIAKNLPDFFDTATPGSVGININSGEGGSPVTGMVISQNVIRDEDVDIAINTPAEVDIHLNDLLDGKIGVANVCVFDFTSNSIPPNCTGTVDATENFWGCDDGPGAGDCTTTSGSNVLSTPWLRKSVGDDDEHHSKDEALRINPAEVRHTAALLLTKRTLLN